MPALRASVGEADARQAESLPELQAAEMGPAEQMGGHQAGRKEVNTVWRVVYAIGFLVTAVAFVMKAPDWAVAGVLVTVGWLERDKLRAELDAEEQETK